MTEGVSIKRPGSKGTLCVPLDGTAYCSTSVYSFIVWRMYGSYTYILEVLYLISYLYCYLISTILSLLYYLYCLISTILSLLSYLYYLISTILSLLLSYLYCYLISTDILSLLLLLYIMDQSIVQHSAAEHSAA